MKQSSPLHRTLTSSSRLIVHVGPSEPIRRSSNGMSATGIGYEALPTFGPKGERLGLFSNDLRIADRRGHLPDPSGALIYLKAVVDGYRRVRRADIAEITLAPGGC